MFPSKVRTLKGLVPGHENHYIVYSILPYGGYWAYGFIHPSNEGKMMMPPSLPTFSGTMTREDAETIVELLIANRLEDDAFEELPQQHY